MPKPEAVRRPTLAHVAERAGVSKKTVSNVINDFPFVTDETRDRVRAAIWDLDYQPNQSARNLARGRTGVVGLAIPELDMPYFSELSREIVEQAQRFTWTVLIEQTLHERAREKRILDGELAPRVDGLLFSPSVACGCRTTSPWSGTTTFPTGGSPRPRRLRADSARERLTTC